VYPRLGEVPELGSAVWGPEVDRQDWEKAHLQVTRPNFRTSSTYSGRKSGTIKGRSVRLRLRSCTIKFAQVCSGLFTSRDYKHQRRLNSKHLIDKSRLSEPYKYK
jgi:hypothetical protein